MKKKLLFTQFGRQWNTLVTKFFRLHRRINSTVFSENYSEQQQNNLLTKLQNLYKRLEKMQYHVGIKVAATALTLMLTSAIASAQTNLWIQQDIAVDSAYLSDETTWPLPATDPALQYGSMAFSDIDGDGNIDCIVGYRNTAIKVWYAGSDGKYVSNPVDLLADGAPILPSPDYHFITFADIDKDGDMDLFVGQSNGTIKEFTKGADKTFSLKGNIAIDGYDALVQGKAEPAFADVDGDGNLDLFISSHGTGGISRFMGKSDGTFTQIDDLSFDGGVTTKLTPFGQFQLVFADLDKDGDMDLYYFEQYVGVWECKNDGSGNFTKGDASSSVLTHSDENGNPEGAIYHGYYPTISFVDLDKDGSVEMYHMVYKGLTYKYLMYGATVSARNIMETQISLYPNPATDMFSIKGLKNDADVRIVNSIGVLKASYKKVSGNINISSLAKGIYFITVNDGQDHYTQKLIKK